MAAIVDAKCTGQRHSRKSVVASIAWPKNRTLARRQQAGLLPNAFSEQAGKLRERDYTLGISLCGKGSLWQDACILVDNMAKSKVSPNSF